jgi:flagellar M-ring protein FliF
MTEMRAFWAGLSGRARIMFLVGVALILVLVGAGGWFALRPNYAPLAQDLQPSDASEIGTALSGWGVPYRLGDGDKTILVPVDQVYALRMKLAAADVPRGKSIGFDAFKDSDYGVTEFAQQVNYQRALQGELERTIESMQEVSSARVHLAIHHAGLFEKDQDPSKGSVTLQLKSGSHLEARQVVGIQRLVASAVDGLKPDAVTVLNQDGTVLSGSGMDGDGSLEVGEQADQVAKLEKSLRGRVSQLLAGALHQNNFTVSVAVQLNYDKVKRVESRLLAQGKDGRGFLVHEKVDSNRSPGSQGVDGTQNGGSPVVTSRDDEYAHGNVQEEVEETPGRIQRISVGVVVPGSLTDTDIKQLSDVVSAGIGLDPSRGDRIDIAAVAPWVPSDTSPAANPDADQHAFTRPSTMPVQGTHVAAAASWFSRIPAWTCLIAAACLLLLGMLIGMRSKGRHSRRLTLAEREATLEQLVQWINQPERVS